MALIRILLKILAFLARPMRSAGAEGPVVVQAYRGYGTPEEVFAIGRVLRQPASAKAWDRFAETPRHLLEIGRRLLRRGHPDVVLEARFAGAVQRVTTDSDGYFRVQLRPREPLPPGRLWHELAIELVEPRCFSTTAAIFIAPPSARFAVISDIDDTVVHANVASRTRMLWDMFVKGADSRLAFPGVAAFYRALHAGRSGADINPMLYVSRCPWSLYEILEEFFNLHDIPIGPLLFLREWGIRLLWPLPRRGLHHKRELIDEMMALYQGMPVVLIGDSGQDDPEIYADIVERHPGRVVAIYIRDVSGTSERTDAIDALRRRAESHGSHLLLADDSLAMARDALAQGFITREGLAEVEAERTPDAPPPREGRRRDGEGGATGPCTRAAAGESAPLSEAD